MRAIVRVAEKHGAWVLADEVYRGAELDGRETRSFWGLYDRLLVTCGLSKAYGLPGLRIGWVAGPAPTIAELWARKDYLSIAPSALSDVLARKAVQPAVRARIFARTRGIVNGNYPVLQEWTSGTPTPSAWSPRGRGPSPTRGTPGRSTPAHLTERLRDEQSVLVVPGDQFGMDGFLRIGLGNEPHDLRAALERIDVVLRSLGPAPGFRS